MMTLTVSYVHLKILRTQVLPQGMNLPMIGEQVVIDDIYYNVKNKVWEIDDIIGQSVAIHLLQA